MRRKRDSDRGAVVLEVLVLAPVFFLLIDLAVFAGTTAVVHSMAHRAAEAAAREASLARVGANAATQASNASSAVTGSQGVIDTVCTSSTISPAPWGTPVGQQAAVTFTTTCSAPVVGVTIPGIPKQVRFTVTTTSVLDPYRWRTP
jgi:hypothetical protein